MRPPKVFDRERLSLNLAKLKKGGENFEVIIDPEKIPEFKSGKISLKELLMYEKVFYDAKKGLEASHEHMQSLFGNSQPLEVAKIILEEGEIQYTQEFREQKRKEKYKRILDIITRNAVDPRTGLPHPRQRIESAMDEAKVRVDEHKEAEDQVVDIVSKLKPVLPIKMGMREVRIRIPATYAGRSYSLVERYGRILSDEWNSDGSWTCIVEVPSGIQNEFFDALNKMSHGEVESKILREK